MMKEDYYIICDILSIEKGAISLTDNENNTGIEALSDDQLEQAAGGKGFQRCEYAGLFEASFPEKKCKGCRELRAERLPWNNNIVITCTFFGRQEEKQKDWWGITPY